MKLKVYRTLWGVLQETDGDKAGSPVLGLEEAMAEIARLGYDGVELPLKCILHLGKDRSGLALQIYCKQLSVLTTRQVQVASVQTPAEGDSDGLH